MGLTWASTAPPGGVSTTAGAVGSCGGYTLCTSFSLGFGFGLVFASTHVQAGAAASTAGGALLGSLSLCAGAGTGGASGAAGGGELDDSAVRPAPRMLLHPANAHRQVIATMSQLLRGDRFMAPAPY